MGKRRQKNIDRRASAAIPEAAPPRLVGSRPQTAIIAGALAILTFALFSRVASHDFVNYDDPVYVTANDVVRRGLTGEGLAWAFTSIRPVYWQPLTWISHMADVSFFGMRAGAHLLVNAALHALSAAVLFLLLVQMTGAAWRSAFLAALWAVHPLRVESVAWVAERKDVLSTLLFLMTVAVYVWYVRRPNTGRFALVIAAFVTALMAKPMVVTLPAVLLLLDVWPLARTETWRRLLGEKAILAVPAAIVLGLTIAGQSEAIGHVSLGTRFANAIVSYASYLWKVIWPTRLAVIYPYRETVAPRDVAMAFALLVAICAVAFVKRKSRPYLAVGWLWYLITLVPVIGILQAGPQSMADRFTYIPMIGLLLAAVWLVAGLASQPNIRRAAAAIAIVAIAVLATATVRQLRHWRDSVMLFSRAVEVTRGNVMAHLKLAEALSANGRHADALPHYQDAARFSKGAPIPLIELGAALLREKRYAEAVSPLEQAARLRPGLGYVRENLGIALLHSGRPAEALPHLEQAISGSDPARIADIRVAIANAKIGSGRVPEGVKELQRLTAAHPGSAALRNELANALTRQGNDAEAERQYREAIRLDPRLYDPRMNLAALLSRLERNDEALAQIDEAARLEATSPEPHVYRALILANLRRHAEAAAAAEQAIRRDARRANDIFTSAVRLAPGDNNLGDFVTAMRGRL